jgi:TniQ
MRRAVVAKTPAAARARLNLAPRFRHDETLSSWLERFAAAYGLKLSEFLRWLGYKNLFSYAQPLIDLDKSPPADLAQIMRPHAGIGPEVIEQHRLVGTAILRTSLRRTFCTQCWIEDGPYRRREWANAWSLVCVRHRSLLCEKPHLQLPIAPNAEDSWTEFYESSRFWRDIPISWERESWTELCDALGINPRTEFLRAYLWLRDLQSLAKEGEGLRAQPDWRVKRDLVIYGTIKFRAPSLLETLMPAASISHLIRSVNPEICTLDIPKADYHTRLFASVEAMHLWERLAQGRWRCRHYRKIEAVLENPQRWNDEDWWLDRRVHDWCAVLRQAGRDLFGKQSDWAPLPPWWPCREQCTRHLPRNGGGEFGIRLPDDWQCQWAGTDDARELITGREQAH